MITQKIDISNLIGFEHVGTTWCVVFFSSTVDTDLLAQIIHALNKSDFYPR